MFFALLNGKHFPLFLFKGGKKKKKLVAFPFDIFKATSDMHGLWFAEKLVYISVDCVELSSMNCAGVCAVSLHMYMCASVVVCNI